MTDCKYIYKICLVGESGVGKSSLVSRYVFDRFKEDECTTIGAAFLCKMITVDGKKIKLELWDTAGQERYRSLAPLYYRDSHTVIVVIDGTRERSVTHAEAWMADVRSRIPDVNIIIAINKSDMDVVVTPKDLDRFRSLYAPLSYMSVSAKTGDNVNELFDTILKYLLERNIVFAPQVQSVRIGEKPPPAQNRCWWF